MSIIPNNGLPWDNVEGRPALCKSKKKFLEAPEEKVAQEFRAIRKFIQTVNEMRYTEEPDYRKLEYYINQIELIEEEYTERSSIEESMLQDVEESKHNIYI